MMDKHVNYSEFNLQLLPLQSILLSGLSLRPGGVDSLGALWTAEVPHP